MRKYLKIEVAMMLGGRDRSQKADLRNLKSQMMRCPGLMRELSETGYDPHSNVVAFTPRQYEIINRYLLLD